MTIEKQDILQDFYQCDTKEIQVDVYTQGGSLKDLSQCELTYTIFRDSTKVPAVLLVKSSIDDGITVEGLGRCLVHILPQDTFDIFGTLRHQLHVQDETGYAGIVMSGQVNIFRSYARRLRQTSAHAYLSA